MYKVMIYQLYKGKLIGKTVLCENYNSIKKAKEDADYYSRIYEYSLYEIRFYDTSKNNIISFDKNDTGVVVTSDNKRKDN